MNPLLEGTETAELHTSMADLALDVFPSGGLFGYRVTDLRKGGVAIHPTEGPYVKLSDAKRRAEFWARNYSGGSIQPIRWKDIQWVGANTED